jgi:hypothetical protein
VAAVRDLSGGVFMDGYATVTRKFWVSLLRFRAPLQSVSYFLGQQFTILYDMFSQHQPQIVLLKLPFVRCNL